RDIACKRHVDHSALVFAAIAERAVVGVWHWLVEAFPLRCVWLVASAHRNKDRMHPAFEQSRYGPHGQNLLTLPRVGDDVGIGRLPDTGVGSHHLRHTGHARWTCQGARCNLEYDALRL